MTTRNVHDEDNEAVLSTANICNNFRHRDERREGREGRENKGRAVSEEAPRENGDENDDNDERNDEDDERRGAGRTDEGAKAASGAKEEPGSEAIR